MLVFGDAERTEEPARICRDIVAGLQAARTHGPGLARHANLVRAFVRAGEIVQGVADREFCANGFDALSRRQAVGARLLFLLAEAVDRSWRTGLEGDPAPAAEITALLEELAVGGPVVTRHAEGFAIYGLYPETYLLAARAAGLGSDTCVIGIRSIGASLGALVAAALGAGPAFSVRPIGHPFRRELRIAPDLAEKLLERRDRPYAVVDEGPGLSGSSFAAVASWLEENGVAPERIHFFPSHGGAPGPQAGDAIRARWNGRARHHVSFEAACLHAQEPAHRLEIWAAELLGGLDGPLTDLSGGVWRDHRPEGTGGPPPSDRPMERRKFLARSGGANWLVKFAGIGAEGVRKLGNARLLASAGLVPEPAGLIHGFLVERWVEGVPLGSANLGRDGLVEGVGRYLAARAALLAPSNQGATLKRLSEMAAHNTAEALGSDGAARLEARLAALAAGEIQQRPIDTDGRLHAWEWLVAPDGRLVKTDALDHSAAHDLVGCQDVAWDVAGAVVEFDLSPAETARLGALVGRAGVFVSDRLVEACLPLYLAFQLGLWIMAAQRAEAGAERARLETEAARYRSRLAALLDS